MTILGLRDTSNFVTDQRPKSWREGIMLLNPNGTAPLFALTSLMPSRSVSDPDFNWWDKSLPARRIQLDENAGLATGDTSLTVISGALQTKAGDLLLLEQTGEIVRVVAPEPTVDTIIPTVVREFAGQAAVIIDTDVAGTNPFMFIVGSAYEEGSDAPTGVNFDPVKRNNFTQIFRNTLEITRTASRTRLRTGEAVREAKREALEMHSLDLEKAFWFGDQLETTVLNKPLRLTDGIENYIPAGNIIDQAGVALDMETLEQWMLDFFTVGSSEKMVFCGNVAALTIQQVIRKNSVYQIFAKEKEFGMNVMRLVSPFGELVIKIHPLFNQIAGGTTTAVDYFGRNSWMFVVDMQELQYVHLDGGDTQFQSKLQANGLDSVKSGYLTEGAMELHHPTSHHLRKGLSGAVADT